MLRGEKKILGRLDEAAKIMKRSFSFHFYILTEKKPLMFLMGTVGLK